MREIPIESGMIEGWKAPESMPGSSKKKRAKWSAGSAEQPATEDAIKAALEGTDEEIKEQIDKDSKPS